MCYNSYMFIPDDDFLLLSIVNTKLRDSYSSLTELCEEEGADINEIISRLAAIGYSYEEKLNSFK